MLDMFYVNPILPAQDGDRAREFYKDVLGLKMMSAPTDDPMMFVAGEGSGICVTETPDNQPASYPVLSFVVTEIEEVVRGLEGRGVTFESPDPSTFQGKAGVADGSIVDYGPVKSAWFKDTEGNCIALNEVVY